MPGLGAHGAAGRVLERHRDVDVLPAGPQHDGTGEHRHTDRDQQPDDDLGGQRINGVGPDRLCEMRVGHPVHRRGAGCEDAYWR